MQNSSFKLAHFIRKIIADNDKTNNCEKKLQINQGAIFFYSKKTKISMPQNTIKRANRHHNASFDKSQTSNKPKKNSLTVEVVVLKYHGSQILPIYSILQI